MRKTLVQKPDRLSSLLFFIFVFFVSVVVWTHIAPKDIVRIFYYYQLDKIVHLLAGWWVVVILLEKLRLRGGKAFFLLICIAVIWELFEFAVFPDVLKIYIEKYAYWLQDTLGDIVAAIFGGIIAFKMFSGKK